MGRKKYNPQKVGYWKNYILKNGGINLISETGRSIRNKAGSAYKDMPTKFFSSLPTLYARQLVYDAVTADIEEFQQLLDSPESLPPGEAKKRADRLNKIQKEANEKKGEVVIGGKGGGRKAPQRKGYSPQRTTSPGDLGALYDMVSEGKAAGIMFRVQGRKPGRYINFGNDFDLLESEISNIYASIKEGGELVDMINIKYGSDLKTSPGVYYFIEFLSYYPLKDSSLFVHITAVPL